jgi:small-conductance mechanosensitive channel
VPLASAPTATPDVAVTGPLWPWVWTTGLLVLWCVALYLVSHALEVRLAARDESGGRRMSRSAVRWVRRACAFGATLAGLYLYGRFAPLPATARAWLAESAEPWVVATVAAVSLLVAALLLVRRLVTWFEARVAETEATLDDILLDAVTRPAYLGVILLAGAVWVALLPVSSGPSRLLDAALDAALILLVVLFLDGLLQGWLNVRAEKSAVLRTSGVIIRAAARALLYAIGGLTALSSLGLDITPALATLGIGSAALGFALQGTVTDFLAGLMIAADQPVHVGDYIRIDEQHQGWVLSIGWRTTRLLTRMDMEVVVPNSKLAASLFVNASRPREDCRFQVSFFAGLGDDLERLVAVATEVAEGVQADDPRAHPHDRCFAFVHLFHEGQVELRVWLCARNYDAHFPLRDAYLRRLSRRLRELGLTLPPPAHRVELASQASAKTPQTPVP